MKFSYTTNIQSVIDDLEAGAKVTVRAVVNALNRTIAQVKTRASREVRAAGYKLKAADIKAAIRVTKASSGRLRADATASGKPIPLMKYSAKQGPGGVSVDVLNGRKVIAHAFIAQTKNGPQVFVREAGGKHKKVMKGGKAVWSSLPIRKLYGPSIPDSLASKAVEASLIALINERFPAILAHEHEWLNKNLDRKPPNPAD